jgi:nitric oxide reductase activation protein
MVDLRDLVEAARRAVLSLRSRSIDVFGFTLDPSGTGFGAAVFGRSQHMSVRRLEDLLVAPNNLPVRAVYEGHVESVKARD